MATHNRDHNRHRSFSELVQTPTALGAAPPTLAITLPGGCRILVHAAHHVARPFFPLQGTIAHAPASAPQGRRCRCAAPDAAVLAHWLLEWRAWNGTRVLAPTVRRVREFRRAARRAICDPAVHEFSHLCRDAIDERGRLRYAAATGPVVTPIWRWIGLGCVGPQPRTTWGRLPEAGHDTEEPEEKSPDETQTDNPETTGVARTASGEGGNQSTPKMGDLDGNDPATNPWHDAS